MLQDKQTTFLKDEACQIIIAGRIFWEFISMSGLKIRIIQVDIKGFHLRRNRDVNNWLLDLFNGGIGFVRNLSVLSNPMLFYSSLVWLLSCMLAFSYDAEFRFTDKRNMKVILGNDDYEIKLKSLESDTCELLDKDQTS